MRTGISITVGSSDRLRLEGVVKERNFAQKHVWRAAIILLSAEGVGTHEIMRRTGTSKTCVWRWQERFMEEGVDAGLCDAALRKDSEAAFNFRHYQSWLQEMH